MTQTELKVETRTDQLERQHRLLKQMQEVEGQIDTYKDYIKSLKDDYKDLEAQLDKLTIVLESEQLTLGGNQ